MTPPEAGALLFWALGALAALKLERERRVGGDRA